MKPYRIIPIRAEFSACTILPGQDRRTAQLQLNPESGLTPREFRAALLARGFDFSGEVDEMEQNNCRSCNACLPVRVDVRTFKPSHSQQRILKRNADLTITHQPLAIGKDYYNLYRHYALARHSGQPVSRSGLPYFLSGCNDMQIVRDAGGKMLGALNFEDLGNCLYAFMNVFDPHETKRSLGTFGILQLIEHARRLPGVTHIYLGHFVPGTNLAYKQNFSVETLTAKGWVPLDPARHREAPKLHLPTKLTR